jgi:hypothetical protein
VFECMRYSVDGLHCTGMDWTGLDWTSRAGPCRAKAGRQGEPGRAAAQDSTPPPPPCMAAKPAVFERELLLYG